MLFVALVLHGCLTRAHASMGAGDETERIFPLKRAPHSFIFAGRAAVLLKIGDNAAFRVRETNRAFVSMQYFGYLRRAPNDAPDSDFSGYNFQLSKLNRFGGNFVQAEMVKAFITSTEHQQRFGP